MTARLVASLAVIAAVGAGCSAQSATGPTAVTASRAGTTAGGSATDPSIPAQLQFSAVTVDGKSFSGRSLAGKPAVLWFWAPWCSVCQGEAPMVARVAAANPAVTFIGVGALGAPAQMSAFVTKFGVQGFTQLADTDEVVWGKFGVTQQPAFAFITPGGGIDLVHGTVPEDLLSQRVSGISRS
ncbi:thiol:disulfide interchange protein [Mycolicibacterium mucogenicum]|uniref:Thiol:disulfide interchange protein n=1 Tax=Mycolicibacterium mucogenicum TaxID=56689 RepID=A0A1A3H456_MYCMU|nr:redoxin domain-containing protein [Mycolicibacterium mucogenicum]OBJ42820.1 thiol:disulfide interchange protein [Mycolicibacterium mucogenicum]